MNCAVCGSGLVRDESWDGSVRLSCPVCKVMRSRSERGQERPIYGGHGRYSGDIIAQSEKMADMEDK